MDILREIVYNRHRTICKERKITMKKTKIISIISAALLTFGVSVSAGAFNDMPDGEMGTALQNAVNAGLINGVTDDTIAPYDNITRAQMAAIITRAFSATEKSEKVFGDVSADAWYADVVSQAAYMGAFEGDDNNNFNPENNITFQETYLVLSRVFGFEAYKVSNKNLMLGDCDIAVLDAFPDKDAIAPWAISGAKYIVGNGGWTGIDGKLKPTDYITRGEFAILMDSIVDKYIDQPGTYKDLGDGLIMVRSGGVIIDGLKSNHNLIITYGVDERGCKVQNSVVNGVTLVLGGIDKTPVDKTVTDGTTKQSPDESHVKIHGNFYDVRVNTPFVYLDASEATVSYYKGVKNSLVSISFQ